MDNIDKLALEILNLSRNTLMLNLRFMDRAISMLALKSIKGLGGIAVDGKTIGYDPAAVIMMYKNEKARVTRSYIHMILHCVYRHYWVSLYKDKELWNLACDIEAEYTIEDINIPSLETEGKKSRKREISELSQKVKYMTADVLYKYFQSADMPESKLQSLKKLFFADIHDMWYERTVIVETTYETAADGSTAAGRTRVQTDAGIEQWSDIARQMKMDLISFSKKQGGTAGSLMQNLCYLTRESYDYSSFLKKFAVLGERMKINDDEFDYIFYTYGLTMYKKMPLIEPLEYKEAKSVRELALVIDTSGSTVGDLVQAFVRKTYNILKESESFFTRFNLHIIQCDAAVQEDAKITSQSEFDSYIANMKILGGGGTDFRPAFSYVDRLIESREFVNLKGLIYFTDGYGIFPNRQPDYKTAFVFVDEGYEEPPVPVWAIKLVLQPDEIRSMGS